MKLTTKQLNKFKALYESHFSITLGNTEALEKGIKLARMMEIVYKPITVKQYQKVVSRIKELNT